MRAYKVALTPPMAPVVLVLDGELQERPGERLGQAADPAGDGGLFDGCRVSGRR